jgi:predicted nicotinamide N-methyase
MTTANATSMQFENDVEEFHSLILSIAPHTTENVQKVVIVMCNLFHKHIWSLSAINYPIPGSENGEAATAEERLERLRKIRIVPWLVSASKQLLKQGRNEELFDTVILLISYLSGKSGSSPIIKRFDFQRRSIPQALQVQDTAAESQKEWTVWIREPSFAQNDIGWTTWGSAVLFSQLLINNELPIPTHLPNNHSSKDMESVVKVLELGCGTGLVGIMVEKWFRTHRLSLKLTMTDYLDSLIDNCRFNVNMNASGGRQDVFEGLQLPIYSERFLTEENTQIAKNDVVDVKLLDWRECQKDGKPSLPENSFDYIVAADCIFDESHSLLVPKVIDRYLSRTPSDPKSGMAIVLVPHRPHYKNEVALFQQEMSQLVDNGIQLVEERKLTMSSVVGTSSDADELVYSLFVYRK